MNGFVTFIRQVAQSSQTSLRFFINANLYTTFLGLIMTLIELRPVTHRVKEPTPHEQKKTRFN